jgi:hypothetical protein
MSESIREQIDRSILSTKYLQNDICKVLDKNNTNTLDGVIALLLIAIDRASLTGLTCVGLLGLVTYIYSIFGKVPASVLDFITRNIDKSYTNNVSKEKVN